MLAVFGLDILVMTVVTGSFRNWQSFYFIDDCDEILFYKLRVLQS